MGRYYLRMRSLLIRFLFVLDASLCCSLHIYFLHSVPHETTSWKLKKIIKSSRALLIALELNSSIWFQFQIEYSSVRIIRSQIFRISNYLIVLELYVFLVILRFFRIIHAIPHVSYNTINFLGKLKLNRKQ